MSSNEDSKSVYEYFNVEEMMAEGKEVPTGRTVLEFDGNNQVLCRVCGDKASGFHYGVHSCEGCKGFFRRSIQKKIQYRRCNKSQQCDVLRVNRNRCQSCRLKKCISAGMSKDAVRFGRVPKREKAKMLAAMEKSHLKTQESKVMTEMADPSQVIEVVVNAHFNTCDYTKRKLEYFVSTAKAKPSYTFFTGSVCPMKGHPGHFLTEQYSEKFMDHVRQVCTFAKLIPGFKCLDRDDQVTLLKLCIFEVLFVRMSGLFENENLFCLNGDIISKEILHSSTVGNARILTNSVFKMAHKFNQHCLSDEEIGLFCAIIIISPDRPGLKNPELLKFMQNKLKIIFGNMLVQHFNQAAQVGELMKIIHDIRGLNGLHSETFLNQLGTIKSEFQHTDKNYKVQKPLNCPQQRWTKEMQEIGSSDTNSTSSEDASSSQSPIGSVSSSESSTSSEVSRLTDLRSRHCSEVFIAPAASSMASRKLYQDPVVTARNKQIQASATICRPTPRKLESPLDSGIDSPHGHLPTPHSTNTSVCSSPISSIEDEKFLPKGTEEDGSRMLSGFYHHENGTRMNSSGQHFSSVFFENNTPNKVEWSYPEEHFQRDVKKLLNFYPDRVEDGSSSNKICSKLAIVERRYLENDKISSATDQNILTNLPKRNEQFYRRSSDKEICTNNSGTRVKNAFCHQEGFSNWGEEKYFDFPHPVKKSALFQSNRIPVESTLTRQYPCQTSTVLNNSKSQQVFNNRTHQVGFQLFSSCPVTHFDSSQAAVSQPIRADHDPRSDSLPLNLSTKI